MVRAVHAAKVQLDAPANDLRILGERLQLSIQLTRNRLDTIKLPRKRLHALRTLDRAEYMFTTISQTVQTVDRMSGFLKNNFGLDIDGLFALTGDKEYVARVSTRSAMLLVNEGISRALKELSALNESLDKESKNA